MVSHTLFLSLAEKPSSIPKALSGEGYPWYDSTRDGPRSVLGYDWSWLEEWLRFNWQPRRAAAPTWNWSDPGELIFLGIAMLLVAILLVLIVEFWRRYRPVPDTEGTREQPGLLQQRIEGLPADIQPTSSDPWSEAQRLRAAGDYAGAIVALFAHQLLTLDRLKQIRLVPGRTGRQFVKSVRDHELKRTAAATLSLFEAAIYGHQPPTQQAFDRFWMDVLAFESRAKMELPPS